MTDETITITKRDIRETARILRGLDTEIQDLKEERRSEGTPTIIRDITETYAMDDSVVSVTEITSTTGIWDDQTQSWDYYYWAE